MASTGGAGGPGGNNIKPPTDASDGSVRVSIQDIKQSSARVRESIDR